MYEVHFGFRSRPFASVPQTENYFAGETIEAARGALLRCMERAEGIGLIVGPSGTGKTLLCQVLSEQLNSRFAVALLSSGRLGNRRALLQAILYALQRPYRGMDEGELRLALIDYLTSEQERPEALVLIVDEAHTLPMRLLDEIRMLTNLVVDGNSKIRLILAGAPSLEERLASPKLESFNQRIVARYYLESLRRAEVSNYIRAGLLAAGARGETVFGDDASQAVYRATDGVPRLINQVCDHAMLLAYANGLTRIDAAVIEEAWADLQQLPTPWSGENRGSANPGMVEFGHLEEEPPPGATGDGKPTRTEVSSAADGDGLGDNGDPVRQLEQIEATLAELAEDFEPAGSIGPEVELVFDECINPFREAFEEEVVLVNRYGVPVRGEPKRMPMRLEPIPEQTLPPAPRSDLPPAYEPQVGCGEAGEDPYQGLGSANVSDAANDAGAVRDESSGTSEYCIDEPQGDEGPETVLIHGEHANSAVGRIADHGAENPDDADMIVVEDGYEAVQTPHSRRVAVVRQREYGQLFARLRKSS